nr:MerR family transcriptional regulator [Mitsuokella multacida]
MPLYTMKQVCKAADMKYETLKFYCNQGLIPHVKRDKNNHRVFDEHDLGWVKSLNCLKNCDFTIAEMKKYLAL